MTDCFPHIEVVFGIEGKNLNNKSFTEQVNILPTSTREIDDWPDAIKNNSNLPKELQPRCVWCLSQKTELCKQVEVPINKIIDYIKGKEQIIFDYCKKNKLKKYLCIIIHSGEMALPALVLPSDMVSYFGKLETEISFDLYID